MRRLRAVILAAAWLLGLVCFAPAAFAADYYEDEESGVRFEIFEGWEQGEVDQNNEYVKEIFYKELHFISYTYGDMWSMIPEEERLLYDRSDINNSTFSEQYILNIYGTDGEVSIVNFGDNEYYVWKGMLTGSNVGMDVELDSIVAVRVYDARMYHFMCQAFTLEDAYVDEFEQMLATTEYTKETASAPIVTIPPAAVQETFAMPEETYLYQSEEEDYFADNEYSYSSYNSDLPSAGGVLLSLILTVVVYSLPIIIYRYGIRKRPMERKAAIKLTVLYGIGALFVMTLLMSALGGSSGLGGAIILWSFINFNMLTRGKDKSNEGNRSYCAYSLPNDPGPSGGSWRPAAPPNPYAPRTSDSSGGTTQTVQGKPYATPPSSVLDNSAWPATSKDLEKQRIIGKTYTGGSAVPPQTGQSNPYAAPPQMGQSNPYAAPSQTGQSNPYAAPPQTVQSNPYAPPQPRQSTSAGIDRLTTRRDLEDNKQKGRRKTSAPASAGSTSMPPSRTNETKAKERQDKYNRGEDRKNRRGEEPERGHGVERKRGHDPHKYWRGE